MTRADRSRSRPFRRAPCRSDTRADPSCRGRARSPASSRQDSSRPRGRLPSTGAGCPRVDIRARVPVNSRWAIKLDVGEHGQLTLGRHGQQVRPWRPEGARFERARPNLEQLHGVAGQCRAEHDRLAVWHEPRVGDRLRVEGLDREAHRRRAALAPAHARRRLPLWPRPRAGRRRSPRRSTRRSRVGGTMAVAPEPVVLPESASSAKATSRADWNRSATFFSRQ